ncbi:MAG: glycosyltransferase family 4 protein [Bacteroidales bacterium]
MNILVYLIITVLLTTAELFYFKLANKFNIIDKPNKRSSHTRITLRGGGVIFYFGAVAAFIVSGFEYPCFFLGLSLITIVSFVDDIRCVPNKARLVIQFFSMLLMFYQLNMFGGFPFWYILIAVVFCTGIINAYNFMDGINGITGGYSLAVLLPLLYINIYVIEFINTSYLLVTIISVLVFNFFNFRKKAKCFAGDVGSVSIAFIILFALGALILKTGNLTYIILLIVYGVDSILTIIHRLMLHENIFEAHRKHMYQIMANELHIPHVVVSFIYMIVQLAISCGFILLEESNYAYFVIVLSLLCAVYLCFMKKWFNLYKM